MMSKQTHDVLVIGAGPAGYVCAIRAAQLGFKVAIVEKEKALGGTCLRIGCIPSKALLESSHLYESAKHEMSGHGIRVGDVKLDLAAMHARKDEVVKQLTGGVAALMKKNKVTVYTGNASFNADKTVTVAAASEPVTIAAKHIVIATGSRPATLRGIELGQPNVDSSTDSLLYDKVPGKLVVIGAGVIGLELGSVWRRLGSQVTVLEYLDRVLPGMDRELADEAEKVFRKQGVTFQLKSRVTGVTQTKAGVRVEIEGASPIDADRVLMAVGRSPNTDGLNAQVAGVTLDERGRIKTGPGFHTTGSDTAAGVNIYAIGDVIAGAMLAHKAEEEGVAVAELIAGQHPHLDYHTMPAIVYTDPEVAGVGRTEEELKEAGIAYRKGKFPFLANGRAKAIAQQTGWVKVLADAVTDRVLGVHIIGRAAGDVIAECAVAMTFGASSEDIARSCHAHPTLSEAVKEAALAVDSRALHM